MVLPTTPHCDEVVEIVGAAVGNNTTVGYCATNASGLAKTWSACWLAITTSDPIVISCSLHRTQTQVASHMGEPRISSSAR